MEGNLIKISAAEMLSQLQVILIKYGFDESKATECAEIFTSNSIDGVYTHGVNRFAKFIGHVKQGYIKINEEPSLVSALGNIEQWNGNLGPGIINAVRATDHCMELANKHGIACVALANTNHWMRGGYYGWRAAKKGFAFIGWTNTIANMPAWNAADSKLGNNPFVMAVPYNSEAIVLDMAMSLFSYGALEMKVMGHETLPVIGGYDKNGSFTSDPSAILESKRPLPAGYWKGAGLSLLLDILATILSGGLSTHEITKQPAEYAVSQVFICIDIKKLGNHSMIASTINNIIHDYQQSLSVDGVKKIIYPGERALATRQKNLSTGIPVMKSVWNEILKL